MIALLLFAAAAQPVLVYERTNSDGSEPEKVVVFARGADKVDVFKSKQRCTNAAYVTARLDPASGQAIELVGGRLGRDLTQQSFAWLTRSDEGVLEARIGARDALPSLTAPVGPRWVIYDFDFSDLIGRPPDALRKGEPVAFDMPLLLMEESGPTLRNLGKLELAFVGHEPGKEGTVLHYRASGPALAGAAGDMRFAAADGRLVEARLPLANHSEYRNLYLRLLERREGEAAWRAVLADHWDGCSPAGQEGR